MLRRALARAATTAAALLLTIGGCGGGGSNGDGDSAGDAGTDDSGETGDDGGEPLVCETQTVGETPLQRLTRAQYANATRDLLGLTANVSALDPDEKIGPFDSNFSAPVSASSIENFRIVAEDLAEQALPIVGDLVPCSPADAGCTEEFIRSFGRRAYRRPLSGDEVSRYLGLAARGEDFDDGIRLVIQGMLQSPAFLYQLEFGLPDPDGGDVLALGGYELAARLSFFLWNSVPDEELLDAADAGVLDNAQGLREQAERLLQDTRARDAVGNFHTQWLGLDELDSVSKDPTVYPQFDDELRDAMAEETRRFAQIVILQGDGKLGTLLTAPFSYIEGPLFELYGVPQPQGHNAGQKVDLPPSERAGLLTQASFLSAHAHPNQSGPIQRGVTVRTNLLCNPPPPPPPGVNAIPPEPDPNATTREIFQQHTADPACAGCHGLIDGIGLGMEGYDGLGIYRETENGLAVDQLGELVATDVDGPFVGAVGLAHKLAASEQVRECVSLQWFRFAFGRIEAEDDQCSMDVLNEAFAHSDYNVRELLLSLVQTDAFRYRLLRQ